MKPVVAQAWRPPDAPVVAQQPTAVAPPSRLFGYQPVERPAVAAAQQPPRHQLTDDDDLDTAERPSKRSRPPDDSAAPNPDSDEPQLVFTQADLELLAVNGLLDTAIYELDQYELMFCEDERRAESATAGVSQLEYISSIKETTKRATLGDYRIAKFNEYMASFNMHRYAPQMKVVSYALSGLIPLMFGDAFEHHQARIEREYRLTDFRGHIYISFPRRRGKTQIMAAIEAAGQAVMGGKTALFAAVLQQASDLKDIIHSKLLEILPKEWIRANNSRRMVIAKPGCSEHDPNAHVGVIRCYSSSVTSARGFTASRIHFDEASFAKAEFYLKNVFAGMLLKNTFVLMVSSPGKDDTPFAKLCSAKKPKNNPNDEDQYENKVLILNNICDKCRRNRKKTQCKHTTMPDPPWFVTREQQEKIRRIMIKISYEAYRAEFMGISESDAVKVFTEESLQRMYNRPRVKFAKPARYVIIGLDPSGGGRSESAVCAMTEDDQGNVVVRFAIAAPGFVCRKGVCSRAPSPYESNPTAMR